MTENIVENSYTDPKTGKFIPGNPGKPKGAKKRRFIDEIDEMLDELAEGKDYTYRKALKKQLLKRMIIDGDAGLLKEYWQQKDGKPRQNIGLDGGEDGKAVNVNLIKYGDSNPV
jgi:hypothetical protein